MSIDLVSIVYTCISLLQDPLKQLKDLTQLKNQLEEIQRRVESEVSAGIPQVCSHFIFPYACYVIDLHNWI